MKKVPYISVIIPTFNRSYVLERAINSVLEQNFKDFELIVVDDGSTDDTSEILKKFRNEILILKSTNQGVSSARNKGIEISNGKYLSFLDSDDYWHRKKLQRQVDVLRQNPEYRVIYTNEIWIRNGKRVNQANVHRKYGGSIYEKCLPLCIISPSSVMIEKNVFNKTGLFDETLPACEDYDLWLRISNKFEIFFLDECLIYKTGGHEDQLSRKFWGMDRFRIKALQKALNFDLTTKERLATIEMIKKKCNILISGFEKRNKISEAEYYKNILNNIKSYS